MLWQCTTQRLQAWPESCQQHWLPPWQAFRPLLWSAKSTKSTLFIPVWDDSDWQSRDSSLLIFCIIYDGSRKILVFSDIFFFLYAFGAFNIIHALFRFSLEIRHDGLSLLCCVIVLVGCFRQWCYCVFIYRLHLSCNDIATGCIYVVYIWFHHITDVLIMSPYKITSVMFRLWRPPGRWCIKKQW